MRCWGARLGSRMFYSFEFFLISARLKALLAYYTTAGIRLTCSMHCIYFAFFARGWKKRLPSVSNKGKLGARIPVQRLIFRVLYTF